MSKFYGWLGGWTGSRGHQRGVERSGDKLTVRLHGRYGAGDTDVIEVILYNKNGETPSVAIRAEQADGCHCLYDGPLAGLLEAGTTFKLVKEASDERKSI